MLRANLEDIPLPQPHEHRGIRARRRAQRCMILNHDGERADQGEDHCAALVCEVTLAAAVSMGFATP